MTGTDNRAEPLARRVRSHTLKMVHRARSSHVGTCLSIADILGVLYADVLRFKADDPAWPERDRFILSKGHGAAALYSVLAESGYFPRQWLATYCESGSPLCGHATSHDVPGVEVSTGSLGHGLPIGCGMALVAKREAATHRTIVLLSDGEMNEGSNWEAALFAQHHQLDNLVAIVDYNKIQSFGRVAEVMALDPLAAKWTAFQWSAREVDGHDHDRLSAQLKQVPFERDKPSVLIAHTTKGKGVSFMEDKLEWHYKSPDENQLRIALDELAVNG